MAFVVPTFNIHCNIWRFGTNADQFTVQYGTVWPPDLGPDVNDVPCNLAWGRRVSSEQGLVAYPFPTLLMTLLLPKLTDIQSPACSGTLGDIVEVPRNSGRVYIVIDVDDIGKGFSNEHRAASIMAFGGSAVYTDPTNGTLYYGVLWPAPIP